jgi:serine/threonine protein kinase/tetratricopeptide (TPR) repeat protein
MSDARARETEIFAEVLLLPPAERASYLAQACGTDTALRQRIEELLNVQGRMADFLEVPNRNLGFSIGAAMPEEDRRRVGRYRLIEKIGEGGCGVVYLAEQDEPVRRQVALKIIKPGMDTREVIARFEAERQALAMMDHPGIAKVLDAGQTESGRPYFVMELIRGTKITDFCDQHALATEERLRLFVQVCHAIQHAHQKGVIHRDIKPSNILVTTSAEGVLQPVVIDFGVAKATVGVSLTDKTLFTAVDMLIGTPTYMSPEQTTLSRSDVDTRADIYSLGVLLYELLTGTTPFDAGELLQLGIDEVRRAIREREPLRPSSRLSKMTRNDLTGVAQHRRSEPPTLIRAVRGDLDWITMKALEKDRRRRYETVNGMAQDVNRFLADEMISARPVSTAYRLKKTVARNKLLFGGLAVTGVLLVGSLIAISSSLAKERRAHAEADLARKQAEADRARALADSTSNLQLTRFLQDLLRGVGPTAAKGRDTTVLNEILEMTVKRVATELADQPAIRAGLQTAIGNVFHQAQLWSSAENLYRQALDGFRQGVEGDSVRLAEVLGHLGFVLMATNQLAEAESLLREALDIRRRLVGSEHPEVATAINDLARVLWHAGRTKEAVAMFREALEMRQRLLPGDHRDITDSLSLRGWVLEQRDEKLAEAEMLQRAVLSRLRKSPEPADSTTYASTIALGQTLRRMGRFTESEATLREAVGMGRAAFSETHPYMASSLVGLGLVLAQQGKFAEAESVFREAMSISNRIKISLLQSPVYDALFGLCPLVEIRGDLAEAESLGRDLLKVSKVWFGVESPSTAAALGRLAGVLISSNRAGEADQLFAEFSPTGFLDTPANGPSLKVRANLLARQGKWSGAEADATLAVKTVPLDFECRHLLAAILVARGKRDELRLNCQTMLDGFGGTSTAIVASRLALDCLVLPAIAVNASSVGGLVETGILGKMEGNWMNYAQCTKALWDYRQGHFAGAIAWSQRSVQSLSLDIRVMSFSVLAMAHFQIGEHTLARSFLSEGAMLVKTRYPKPDSGDLGAEWKEGIQIDLGSEWKGGVFARALLEEAQVLIEPRQKSGL